MIKVKDLEMGVHTGLSIHTGIILKVEEEGRKMGLRDSRGIMEEVGHEPRNMGNLCLETGNISQLTASKKIGTSVLQPQETDFCQQGMGNEMEFSLKPSESNTAC